MKRRVPWWAVTGLAALVAGPTGYLASHRPNPPHPMPGERVYVGDPFPEGATTGFRTFRALDGRDSVTVSGTILFQLEEGKNGSDAQYLDGKVVRIDGDYLYLKGARPSL